MFKQTHYKENDYPLVLKQLEALIQDEPDLICNLANTSALLFQFLRNVNWVGFYLYKEQQLVLGPFIGLPACTRIPIGKGVCGTAFQQGKTLYVENVHKFPGHIACDARSNSEVVIPVFKNNSCIGVLDIDSYEFNNFSQEDLEFLQQFVGIIEKYI